MKNGFNIDRSELSNENKKEVFNRYKPITKPKEEALGFSNKRFKIDPINLVYIFKICGDDPKKFRNYQMPLKLFEDLRYGDTIPLPPNKYVKKYLLF